MKERSRTNAEVSPEVIARGSHRVRILNALHGICLNMERLHQSEISREACREVAGLLAEAREREQRRLSGV